MVRGVKAVLLMPHMFRVHPVQERWINRVRLGTLPVALHLWEVGYLCTSCDERDDNDAAANKVRDLLSSWQAGGLLKTDADGRVQPAELLTVADRLRRHGCWGEGPQRWCGTWGDVAEQSHMDTRSSTSDQNNEADWVLQKVANDELSRLGLGPSEGGDVFNNRGAKWLQGCIRGRDKKVHLPTVIAQRKVLVAKRETAKDIGVSAQMGDGVHRILSGRRR